MTILDCGSQNDALFEAKCLYALVRQKKMSVEAVRELCGVSGREKEIAGADSMKALEWRSLVLTHFNRLIEENKPARLNRARKIAVR